MNPKLLIVADHSLLKAYELRITPKGALHLDRIKTVALDETPRRAVEKAADPAEWRAAPAQKNAVDARHLNPETRRRVIKRMSELIEELIQKNSKYGVWLAAPQEINYLLTSALLKSIRQRIEANLTLNLVHADEKEVLECFAPPAFVKPAKK